MASETAPKRLPVPRKAPLLFTKPPEPRKRETLVDRFWFWFTRWGAAAAVIATSVSLITSNLAFFAAQEGRLRDQVADARKTIETPNPWRTELAPDLLKYITLAGDFTGFHLGCATTQGCTTLAISFVDTGAFRAPPTITDVDLNNIDVMHVALDRPVLTRVTIADAKAEYIDFNDCSMQDVAFRNLEMWGVNFSNCTAEGELSFEGSDLSRSNITDMIGDPVIDVSGATICRDDPHHAPNPPWCLTIDENLTELFVWDWANPPIGLLRLDRFDLPMQCEYNDQGICDALRKHENKPLE
jgi:hypothetical protein